MSRRGAIVRLELNGSFPFVLVEGGWSSGKMLERGVIRPTETEGTEPLAPPAFLVQELRNRRIDWVAFEVPMERTVTNLLDLPPMKTTDAKKALPFEFERKLPISLDNFCWSFSVLETNRKGVQALAAGVPKTVIMPYLESLRQAGITVRSVELGALRFHARQVTAPDVLSVGLGEGTADLVILKNGKPVSLKGLNLPPDPALLPDVLARAVEGEAEKTQSRDIWLYGKTDYPGVREAFARLGGRKLHVLESMPREGAATRRGPFLLDLLPAEFRRKRNPHNIILAALMLLLVASFYVQITVKSRIDRKALAEVTQELETLRQSVDEASGTLKERENAIRSLRILRPFFADSNRPFVALRELSRILPKDTWLVNFDMDEKGKLEIDGYSSRSSALVGLIDESKWFTGAEMAGPVIVQPLGEHFTIRMYWEQVSSEK